jgi:hypothetical protein
MACVKNAGIVTHPLGGFVRDHVQEVAVGAVKGVELGFTVVIALMVGSSPFPA